MGSELGEKGRFVLGLWTHNRAEEATAPSYGREKRKET